MTDAPTKQSDGLMKPEDVAQYLGYTRGTIYQKVSRGEIPFVKLGHAVRFRKADIDAWVEAQQ